MQQYWSLQGDLGAQQRSLHWGPGEQEADPGVGAGQGWQAGSWGVGTSPGPRLQEVLALRSLILGGKSTASGGQGRGRRELAPPTLHSAGWQALLSLSAWLGGWGWGCRPSVRWIHLWAPGPVEHCSLGTEDLPRGDMGAGGAAQSKHGRETGPSQEPVPRKQAPVFHVSPSTKAVLSVGQKDTLPPNPWHWQL